MKLDTLEDASLRDDVALLVSFKRDRSGNFSSSSASSEPDLSDESKRRKVDRFEDASSDADIPEDIRRRKVDKFEDVVQRIPLSALEEFMHIPLHMAAKELHVSLTMLKKLCRSYNIKKWPHRQVQSCDNAIENLLKNEGKRTEHVRESKLLALRQKRADVITSASSGSAAISSGEGGVHGGNVAYNHPATNTSHSSTSERSYYVGVDAGRGGVDTHHDVQGNHRTKPVEVKHASQGQFSGAKQVEYMSELKVRLEPHLGMFQHFLEIMVAHGKGDMTTKQVLTAVSALLTNHPDLLRRFICLLPVSEYIMAKEYLNRTALEREIQMANIQIHRAAV